MKRLLVLALVTLGSGVAGAEEARSPLRLDLSWQVAGKTVAGPAHERGVGAGVEGLDPQPDRLAIVADLDLNGTPLPNNGGTRYPSRAADWDKARQRWLAWWTQTGKARFAK